MFSGSIPALVTPFALGPGGESGVGSGVVRWDDLCPRRFARATDFVELDGFAVRPVCYYFS